MSPSKPCGDVRSQLLIYHVDWMGSVLLQNASVAQATLTVDIPTENLLGDIPQGRIIQDVRKNTFLGALASIGGLLAVLQGLHVLCFGRPLFWGLFGTRPSYLALHQL
jgi:hypothetical protein